MKVIDFRNQENIRKNPVTIGSSSYFFRDGDILQNPLLINTLYLHSAHENYFGATLASWIK